MDPLSFIMRESRVRDEIVREEGARAAADKPHSHAKCGESIVVRCMLATYIMDRNGRS